ncbi:hypothetical protein R3W88_029173 [Solanum pinnatisectum]|uniref:Uncharacterized protein n=1 Tax=Solanum pinnatisectum TaxID=50273 RepID=A0AAV9K4L7_9SOLN|nr:hypothetical protein R3W88_029173 [Solanum pinnatisectum]
MIDEVEIVFNYGGSWVISPQLVYTKKLVHSWLNFDPELLSHKDICDEFTSNGPSDKYYILDGDDGTRVILSLLYEKFKVGNFFVVEEGELTVFAQNITQYSESCFVDLECYIEVVTDCEHNVRYDCEWDLSEGEECDYEWMEAISKESGRVVGDRLENFKKLQVLNYYALANKRALTIIKGDTKRTRYGCDEGFPFRCLISRDGKTEAFFNPIYDSTTLAQYFKNKLQNNPKYKRIAFEKLEGSFIDDYNKLEAYAIQSRKYYMRHIESNWCKKWRSDQMRKLISMVICESELRGEKLKTRIVPTGSRKIEFAGDHTGASMPTNMSYSPIKTTWKGKEDVSAGHVQMKAKKKRIKMMRLRGEDNLHPMMIHRNLFYMLIFVLMLMVNQSWLTYNIANSNFSGLVPED